MFHSCPNSTLSIFLFFQLFKNLGILREDAHFPWNLDNDETKNFEDTWSRIYECYRTKIRRQRERAKKTGKDVKADVLAAEAKLKSEHFICPDIYGNIFGGIVPCRRQNARKRT